MPRLITPGRPAWEANLLIDLASDWARKQTPRYVLTLAGRIVEAMELGAADEAVCVATPTAVVIEISRAGRVLGLQVATISVSWFRCHVWLDGHRARHTAIDHGPLQVPTRATRCGDINRLRDLARWLAGEGRCGGWV